MRAARTINPGQISLYRFEWNKARRILRQTLSPAEADARRHEIHVEALGVDKSSTALTNDDLDEVLKRFRAITKPADFTGQIALDDQAAKRARYKVTQLLAALGKDQAHVDRLIAKRHESGHLVTAIETAATGFETLGPADLERLALDLKTECRRRWKRKGDLLTELRLMRMEFEFDEATTNAEVGRALKLDPLPAPEALGYDDLLKVIATMRGIMNMEIPF